MCVYILCIWYTRAVGCVYTRVYWVLHVHMVCSYGVCVCSDACVHFMLPAVSVHMCHCVVNVHMVCSWGVCGGTRVHIYVVVCVYMCGVYVCMRCSHTVCVCVCV